MTDADNAYLKKIYTDPRHAGGFAGAKKLHEVVKNEGQRNLTLKTVKTFLETQDTYTVHRPARRRYATSKVVVYGIRQQYDADLMDMQRLSPSNDNVTFVLVLIDDFSRLLFVKPLRSKSSKSMLAAFRDLFEKDHTPIPESLRSDKGLEFQNAQVRAYLESLGIKQFTATNQVKSNIAERVIGTLKQLIYRYLYQTSTYRYLDQLDNLVSNYNERPHRSLFGLAPTHVTTENQVELWNLMHIPAGQNVSRKVRKYRFRKGDRVRISYVKRTFERAYQTKYTEEVFRVTLAFRRRGLPVYKLSDLADEPVDAVFYADELVRVLKSNDDLWKIDKILKTRGKGKNKQALVKWLGFPSKFDSWVLYSDVKSLR